MRTLLVAALILLSAPLAQAQAPAARYVLDPAHTQVAFSIERFGFNRVLGRFEKVTGEVMLDQANPARSSVNATIETASVSAGDATRDEHLRGERWLDVARYPTMTFRSTSVKPTGPQTAEVIGDLTLHGQTKPVTLTVTLNKLGNSPSNNFASAGFSATGVVSRAAFGIAIAPQLIGDEVRITIEALAQQPRP